MRAHRAIPARESGEAHPLCARLWPSDRPSLGKEAPSYFPVRGHKVVGYFPIRGRNASPHCDRNQPSFTKRRNICIKTDIDVKQGSQFCKGGMRSDFDELNLTYTAK